MPTLRDIKGFGAPKCLVPFILSVCIGVTIVRIASRFQIYAKSRWRDRIPLPIADD